MKLTISWCFTTNCKQIAIFPKSTKLAVIHTHILVRFPKWQLPPLSQALIFLLSDIVIVFLFAQNTTTFDLFPIDKFARLEQFNSSRVHSLINIGLWILDELSPFPTLARTRLHMLVDIGNRCRT